MFVKFFSVNVDTKPGDVIIFDSRIPHASTLPKLFNSTISSPKLADKIHLNDQKSKFAIYCNLTDRFNYKSFLNNSFKRYKSKERNDFVEDENEFFNYVNFSYPEHYPKEFIKFCSQNNINIATLDE